MILDRKLFSVTNDVSSKMPMYVKWTELFRSENPSKIPSIGVRFMDASVSERSFTLTRQQQTIKIRQDLNSGIGGCVWDCGEAMLWFIDQYPSYIEKKRIMELGSGTGISGIGAAVCGAFSVCLSDLGNMLELIEDNIRKNFPAIDPSSKIKVIEYLWGEKNDTNEDVEAEIQPTYDTILCSDCLYDGKEFPKFFQSLCQLAHCQTDILLTYKKRLHLREKSFFQALEKDFHIGVYSLYGEKPFSFKNDVYICLLQRKCNNDQQVKKMYCT